tara:strand:+ start:2894 stop:3277 length:384 start_codon:yes stop_codon:yes gene_type:complete
MKKILSTKKAPAAIGTYSQGVVLDNLIFTSGQIGIDPSTGTIMQGGIEAETKQVLENIESVLIEGGVDRSNIVKLTVYLKDFADFPVINNQFKEFFIDCTYPARSTVEVSKLPMDAMVEIDCIAYGS